MSRQIAIGDIHGGKRALLELLDKVRPGAADELIFLGDYVDGWSDSAAVIDLLMELSAGHSCVFLKGNHDIWCGDWLDSGIADKTWLQHGGSRTAREYERLSADAIDRHRAFFRQMPFFHIDAANRLFVHAGFSALQGPLAESDPSYCAWDRSLWQEAMDREEEGMEKGSRPARGRLSLFTEIYIGHTPTLNFGTDQPMHCANVWNLDTGSAFTGPLTAMDTRSKQVWQTAPVRTYYPGERGRNTG